jgi:hypothetical protein
MINWKRNDLQVPAPQDAVELTEFKSHSGLKVGETKLMLVRKVSSGVCEYAPADDLEARVRELGGKLLYIAATEFWADSGLDGWAKVPTDLREYCRSAVAQDGGVGEIIERQIAWHKACAADYREQAHWQQPFTDIRTCDAKAEAHEDAVEYLQSQINGAENMPTHMDAGCNGPAALARELRRVTPDMCMEASVRVAELCHEAARQMEEGHEGFEVAKRQWLLAMDKIVDLRAGGVHRAGNVASYIERTAQAQGVTERERIERARELIGARNDRLCPAAREANINAAWHILTAALNPKPEAST